MYNFPQILRDNWKKLHINILFQLIFAFSLDSPKKKIIQFFSNFQIFRLKTLFPYTKKISKF